MKINVSKKYNSASKKPTNVASIFELRPDGNVILVPLISNVLGVDQDGFRSPDKLCIAPIFMNAKLGKLSY